MKNQTEEIAKTEVQVLQPELKAMVVESQIEITKAEAHALAFSPSLKTLAELSRPLAELDKVNPTAEHAAVARETRLKLVKVRTGAEAIKNERKAGIVAEGNLIQDAFNFVKSACIVTENEYLEIEKHQEKIELEQKELLAKTRLDLLKPFETDTTYMPLGVMTEEQFLVILNREKEAFEAITEQRKQAEIKRLAEEKEAEEKRLAEIEEKRIADEKEKTEREAEEKRIREENEALRKEKEKQQFTDALIQDRTKKLLTAGFLFDGEIFTANGFKSVEKSELSTLADKGFDSILKSGLDAICKERQRVDQLIKDRDLLRNENAKKAVKFLISIGYEIDEHGVSHPDYHSFIGSAHFSFLDTKEDLELFIEEKNTYHSKQLELKATAEKNANLEAENKRLKELQDIADLAHDQEKQRIQDEENERKAKEKAALNAPDVDKLRAVYAHFNSYEFPEMTTEHGKIAVSNIITVFNGLLATITLEATKLK